MVIDLNDQELRYVLEVLATRPFNQVAALIPKIAQQAEAQVEPAGQKQGTTGRSSSDVAP